MSSDNLSADEAVHGGGKEVAVAILAIQIHMGCHFSNEICLFFNRIDPNSMSPDNRSMGVILLVLDPEIP